MIGGDDMKILRKEIVVKSCKKEEFINITEQIRESIKESGVKSGVMTIFSPHTTAGLTINDGSDPDVARDMLLGLSKAFPEDNSFLHMEGNSTAHLKCSAMSSSITIIIHEGLPDFGIWQAAMFGDFDGPRTRRIIFSIMGE